MAKNRTARRLMITAITSLATGCLSPTHAQGICRAPGALPPCGATAPTDAPAEPDLDLGISNPIQIANGEKFLRAPDLPPPRAGLYPGFVRFYRTGDRIAHTQPGTLGPGWRSLYDARLEAYASGWALWMPDGRRLDFDREGRGAGSHGGRLHPGPRETTAVTARGPASDNPWRVWQGSDGRRLGFDDAGRLIRIERPGQPPADIQRHAHGELSGLIHRIIQSDRRLELHYIRQGKRTLLSMLDTPLGRFHYAHDDRGRLQSVQRPDGSRRHYHYEDRAQSGHDTYITGVTLEDPEGRRWRARSWSYDRSGRVVQAIPGPPGQTAGRLTLHYDADRHRTELRAGNRMLVTEHAHHGDRTVVAAHSLSCPSCAPEAEPIGRDQRGQLTRLGPLRIQRHPEGAIAGLQPGTPGWPRLSLQYDRLGRKTSWHSALTGATRFSYGPNGRLRSLRYANGDALDIRHDAAGRPVHLAYTGPGKAAIPVRLRWRGDRLSALEHPDEQEQRQYDAHGRLFRRTVRRPLQARRTLRYQETFDYDEQGRLRRHGLPEGGALQYEWGAGRQLLNITWTARDGTHHTVIHAQPGEPGYHYGNGLRLQAWTDAKGRADTLILSTPTKPLWVERRAYGRGGTLQHQIFARADTQRIEARYLDHDAGNRLRTLLTAENSMAADGTRRPRGHRPRVQRFTWHGDGARRQNQTPISRDASGLPLSVGAFTLRHTAQRRVAEVVRHGAARIRYTYNAQGHLIRRAYGDRQVERYYLDNRLAAIWVRPAVTANRPALDSGKPATAVFGVTQRYIYASDVPVGVLVTDARGHSELYFVHADLQGAPVMVTDKNRAVRTTLHYDGTGRATRIDGDIPLGLRWPGQDEDPVTGWHDNVFRTYHPRLGQYLEPDPLGPLPGQQALGYAAQQPQRHIDPLGLLLMAFDGTRYNESHHGNVWKLAQLYRDGAVHYHAGPGNNAALDWDAVTASSGGEIVRTQWQALLNDLRAAQGQSIPTPIDILGFSRGAALARDFANQIAHHTRDGWFSYDDPLQGAIGLCVDLRFMGLFDSVAQFGLLGSANAGYDLSITDAWSWVAHAVALHEQRMLFPLLSATDGAPANTVEAPFIGAHADIGGGLLVEESGRGDGGDLSDVALNWMHWQALAANVPMALMPEHDRTVSRPLLHDERPRIRGLIDGSDRDIQDHTGRSKGAQGNDTRLGNEQRRLFEPFIRRLDDWRLVAGNVVGEVDMQAYGAWLNEELGVPLRDGPVQ